MKTVIARKSDGFSKMSLMGTEIFWFCQKLCLWRPFKEGTSYLVLYFGGTFLHTITWAQDYLDIFSAHNVMPWAICWTPKFLDLGLICAKGSCLRFKESNFASIVPFNPCNLGLEWHIWILSKLKIIVFSVAFWWAINFFDFCPMCALGRCS